MCSWAETPGSQNRSADTAAGASLLYMTTDSTCCEREQCGRNFRRTAAGGRDASFPDTLAESAIHDCGVVDAGGRDRGEHGGLQLHQWRVLAAAAVSRPRPAGDGRPGADADVGGLAERPVL